MNETVFQSHYARAMQRGKRLDSDKSRKVHKAICAAIGAKGMPGITDGYVDYLGVYYGKVYDAAKTRLKQQYGSIVGFIMWPLIWAVLRPILEAMLPIIIEWLIEQAMSSPRFGSGEAVVLVDGMKEWGNA